MNFITEIPGAADIQAYDLQDLLAHEHQTWTVNKSRPAFLILQRETKDPLYDTREDFYFRDQTVMKVVSFGLKLEHEANCLNFHWYLIGTYGYSRIRNSRPALLQINNQGNFTGEVMLPCAGSIEMLECLRQAFIAYKTGHGFRESGTQKMMVDYSRVLPCDSEDKPIIINPDGSVTRP